MKPLHSFQAIHFKHLSKASRAFVKLGINISSCSFNKLLSTSGSPSNKPSDRKKGGTFVSAGLIKAGAFTLDASAESN